MLKLLALYAVIGMIATTSSVSWGKKANLASKGFGLSITTDKAVYYPQEPINITLTIFNHTEDTVTFTFTSSQRYDFSIKREGKNIWRWSANKAFAQVMGKEKIEPRESLVYKETYRPGKKLAPGIYLITGIITCKGPLKTLEGTICIQVSERESKINKKLEGVIKDERKDG